MWDIFTQICRDVEVLQPERAKNHVLRVILPCHVVAKIHEKKDGNLQNVGCQRFVSQSILKLFNTVTERFETKRLYRIIDF